MLKKVVQLDITISRLNPLRGSFRIPLPDKILRSKAVTNIKNYDNECFRWAITRALHPVPKNAERITKELRKQADVLDWSNIEFPTPCSSKMFKTFEENNKISLLVFGHTYKGRKLSIVPLYVPKERREKIVRLFFIKSDDGTTSHYCVINNMSRLVGSQINKYEGKKYVCDYCLNCFGSEERRQLR